MEQQMSDESSCRDEQKRNTILFIENEEVLGSE